MRDSRDWSKEQKRSPSRLPRASHYKTNEPSDRDRVTPPGDHREQRHHQEWQSQDRDTRAAELRNR
ncbi:hypothetical protein [Mumia zhuanghuii]|uniref:Uncharacterized protein n=1 Tax=Mumia zhuanghuii TaxID=2585211 RepID=A0A5C4MB30_9ACTN|nr:hypothetical protein [Mumia zhuanghuii]TNC31319.1 hypothetical protein FHE65_32130 [Mumia zhuanghuii]